MSSRTTKLLIFTRTSAVVKVRIEHKMIENFTFAELNNYNCSKVIVIIGGMGQQQLNNLCNSTAVEYLDYQRQNRAIHPKI